MEYQALTALSTGDFASLRVLKNGAMQNILDLLAASGGSGSGSGIVTSANLPLSITNGVLNIDVSGFCTAAQTPLNLQQGLLTIDLTNYVTSTVLNNTLAGYTDTTGLTNLLLLKQDLLQAGSNISIVGSTISSTPLALQLDGVTQAGATTLNFVANTASYANGVLNVSRMTYQDALTLRYSTAATDKDLTQGSAGELLWGGLELQLRQNAFHSISVAKPLTASGANNLLIDLLWKPSTVSVGSGLSALANDTTGTLQLALTGTESRAQLSLIDTQGVTRNLVPSITGALTWDGSTLVDLTYHTNALTGKQDNLSAGANVTLSNNVISALGDATQAWVTANFLSPLNPGTVGVTAGLSSTMTANTFIISVDENSDSRTLFTLRDPGNVARNITASSQGQLLWDGGALATESQLATKQNSLSTSGQGVFLNGSTLSGYDLRWNTGGVPTAPIECLHFKGMDVTQAVNLSSGQIELQVEPTIASITNLQNEVDKLTHLVPNAVSGISLGTGAGASQRIALYEIEPGQTLTPGHYFYGMGLFEGASQSLGTGTAFWGGSGTALPDQFGTGGRLPDMLITFAGNIGIQNRNPSQVLDVTGNIACSGNLVCGGTITGASKSFDIPHPEVSKRDAGWRLKHWVVETDTPAGLVMYRRKIEMTATTATMELPPWFSDLVTDCSVVCTPIRHFGSGWGEVVGDSVEIHTTTLGEWHVIILGSRADEHAMCCDKEVEYIPEQPSQSESGSPFPTP